MHQSNPKCQRKWKRLSPKRPSSIECRDFYEETQKTLTNVTSPKPILRSIFLSTWQTLFMPFDIWLPIFLWSILVFFHFGCQFNLFSLQVLLPASSLLQIHSVREACCKFLLRQLHPSNCLGIRSFAGNTKWKCVLRMQTRNSFLCHLYSLIEANVHLCAPHSKQWAKVSCYFFCYSHGVHITDSCFA